MKYLSTILVGTALLAGPTAASTVTLSYDGMALKETAHISTQSGAVYAGQIKMTNTSTSEKLLAFCVDVFHNLASPRNYTPTATMFDTTVRKNVQRLFNTAYTTVNSAAEAAGFQMALWEIVTESGPSLSIASGNFSTNGSSAANGFATSYLSGLSGPETGHYRVTYLNNLANDSQDLVTVAPVPLPAAGMLLIGGLAAMGGLRSKRRAA